MSNIQELRRVKFQGLAGGKDVSAVSFWKDRALLVADEMTDEGNVVQAFEKDGDHFRATAAGLTVLDRPGPAEEMDLEGIAVDGSMVYVLGSHSSKRKKVEKEKSYAKNRAALLNTADQQPARDVLLRFELNTSGVAGPIQRTSLRAFLDSNEPFKSFRLIAGKENGIDVEGLAVRDNRVYIGFRGPVLRGNYTPVLKCSFGSPITDTEILFVNLGGRGVRDLARVDDGLILLAGPVGDGPGSYQLYLWDGRDGIPGHDSPDPTGSGLKLIGDLPLPESNSGDQVKAEGVAVVKEKPQHWELMIVFDGLPDAHATCYRVDKPT